MAEQQNSPNQPDPERIREATKIVLGVLDQWHEGPKKPASPFSRLLEGITNNWVLLSFLVVVLACLYKGVSPFHTLEDVAREQKKRQFTLEMANRHLKLGKGYLDVSRYSHAKAEFDKALILDPANVEAQLGLIKAEAGDLVVQGLRQIQVDYSPEVIKKKLDLVLAEKSKDPHVQVILGNMAFNQGKYKEAEAYYRQALAADSKVASACFGLGLIYDKQGETEKALEMWQKAVGLSEWNTEYRTNLAYLYGKKGDYPQAIATYEEIIDQDPSYLIAFHELAQVYRIKGELAAARYYQQELISLLEKLPDQPTTIAEKNQAVWYYKTKHGSEVVLASVPEKKVLAYYNLAITQYLLQEKTMAQASLKRAPVLGREEQSAILALIDDDLTRLAKMQPSWQDRLIQLRQELFPKLLP